MENFNYKDYCIGITVGINFPKKFSIEDRLGEISDYYIEKCSFDKRQTLETPSGVILQLNKDLMEVVIDKENFTGSYLYFYGDKIKDSIFPDEKNKKTEIKLQANPFVYRSSYEKTKNDFKNVFSLLFRYFRKLNDITKINRVGMVHNFLIFYEDIKFRYAESLKRGADLPIGENHKKLARNQYSYDKTDSSWKNAIIEFMINKEKTMKKPFGKLSLDVQTYYDAKPVLFDKLGGEEKVIDELFNQTYGFIDKSKLFNLEEE